MEWDDQAIAKLEQRMGNRVQAAGRYLVGRIRENLSTAGTRIAGSKFIGRGVHVDATKEGPAEKGMAGVEGSKTLLNAFGRAGKVYRKGRRIYGGNPSKPGEFPHKQKGWLRQSIAMQYDPAKIRAIVGTNLAYGKYLEEGTRKMAPRSFLRRTLKEEKSFIQSIIVGGGRAED